MSTSNVTPLRGEPEVYINRQQLAQRLGVGLTTVDAWRVEGMPSHTWGLRVRRFRFSECEQWLRKRDRKTA